MSLLSADFEPCVFMEKHMEPTTGGDFVNTWTEGAEFRASFDFRTSTEAKIAEAQGVTGLWDIYTYKGLRLDYHDVIKRKSDGRIFRVTSKDDAVTPKGAGLKYRVVSAEEWELA